MSDGSLALLLVSEPDLVQAWLARPEEAEARDRALLAALPPGIVERTAEHAVRVCGSLEALQEAAHRLRHDDRRVALHQGPVVQRTDPLTGRPTVLGPATQRLAEVLRATPPGAIGLSAEVHRSLGSPPSTPLLGVADAVALHAHVGADLPERPGPLVGRDAERDRLLHQLRHHRWVTLCGPGGVGKSRLALELAHTLDAVWVDATRGPLPGELAAALGTRPPELGQVLADRGSLVVVIDEAEHTPDPIRSLLEALQTQAPALRVLVTSRRRLGGAGEVVVDLAPLAIDAAAALLCERVPELDPAVAERVAAAVDRLPLALELVAARVAAVGPEGLLTTAEQLVQRGMEPVIEASWTAARPEERAGLAALTAFCGPFDPDAGEAVVAQEGVLDALIAQSLVSRQGARLALLETVRAYARTHGDPTPGLARHADWFATDVPVRIVEAEAVVARKHRLQRDHAELLAVADRFPDDRGARAMLRVFPWAVHHLPADDLLARLKRVEDGAADPVLAARLTVERGAVVRSTGDSPGAQALFDDATDRLEALGAVHAAAMSCLLGAKCSSDAWDEDDATARLRRGIDLATRAGTDGLRAQAWTTLARLEARRADPRARDHLELALRLARDAGDLRTVARALVERSRVHVNQRNVAAALDDVAQAVAICARYEDVEGEASALNYEALARIDAGQPERAADIARRSIRICRRIGNGHLELYACSALGFALVLADRAPEAATVLEEAQQRARKRGQQGLTATLRGDLGLALADLGRPAAIDHLTRASEAFAAIGNPHTAALYGRYAAAACALAGDPDRARSLWVADPPGTREEAQLRGVIDPDPAVLAAERERIEAAGDADPDLRIALRWHARRVAAISPAVTVQPDGVLDLQDGTRVDLSRRAAPRRILLHLARRRVEAPGASTTLDQLVAVGWPGERIVSEAASNRAYVAIATLRKAGLAALLQTGAEGYRLDPAVPLRLTQPPRP